MFESVDLFGVRPNFQLAAHSRSESKAVERVSRGVLHAGHHGRR